MKLTVEPERFRTLLRACLVHKSSPILDKVTATFKPNGVEVNDLSIETLAVKAVFTKGYFTSYECEKDEVIALSNEILDKLSWGFNDDKITIYTEGNEIKIEGKTDKFSYVLDETKVSDFIPIQLTDYGIIPEKHKRTVQILVNVDNLLLPNTDRYAFESDTKDLKVGIRELGKWVWNRKITPAKVEKLEKLTARFNAEHFQHIVANLSGEVWFLLDEGSAVFATKTKDFALTYAIASIEEL